MDFCSTRNSALRISGPLAALRGPVEDGGLPVPARLPRLTEPEIMMMAAMNYQKTAETVLSAFLPEELKGTLGPALKEAYGPQFDSPQIAPVRRLRPGSYVLELWHGPTGTLADIPMQLLARLLPEQDAPVSLIAATNGSVGLAARNAFSQTARARLCLLWPQDAPSRMQQLALCAAPDGKTLLLPLQETLTVAQTLAADLSCRDDAAVLPADSNSWLFVAAEIVPYFWAYAQLLKTGDVEMGQPVNFVVPCGNLGSLLAGCLAKLAGLPVGKLICASGSNHGVTEFCNNGMFSRKRPFCATQAPGLDVTVPAQLERLLYVLCQDGSLVARWMEALRRSGHFSMGDELTKKLHEAGIQGFWCDDIRASRTMRELWFDQGYLCDPHTGVAMNAQRQYAALTGDKAPSVVLSTATPFLYASAMLPAMDLDFQGDDFQQLEVMEIVGSRTAPAFLEALKGQSAQSSPAYSREGAQQTLARWLAPAEKE